MKLNPYYFVLLLVSMYSCQKNVLDQDNQSLHPLRTSDSTSYPPGDSTATPPFPLQTFNTYSAGGSQPSACPLLPYGDTILFPQPTSGEDIVMPVNSTGPGKYFAWPAGMTLDQNTGAIDLSQSQAGMRYAIAFVPNGTTDTCISTLIIGGAAYYDSIFVLGDGDTLARPYFNANAWLTDICTTPGMCSFDYNGQAAKKGVIVDSTTGVIRLGATINGKGQLKGLFGSVPKDGSTAMVNIDYRLNDGSHDAPQHITVQFEFYDSRSAIAPGLVNNLETKSFNAVSDRLISTSLNPRPPVIIITRRH